MAMWFIRFCIFAVVASIAVGTLPAQRSYSPGDVEDGKRLFVANCAVCHGPDGNAVAGVDFGHGKFRRATSDNDLIQILKSGIPGTAMPEFLDELSQLEIGELVIYLRYIAASNQRPSAPGDAVRGKALFEGTGQCLNCHRVKDKGSRTGPDLTEIGSVRRLVELERSILEPGAEMFPQNRFVRVVTGDGVTITGRLLNQDTFTVQLMDENEQLRSFQKSILKGYSFIDKSQMPSYKGKLNAQDLTDLVSYLASLKGIVTQ